MKQATWTDLLRQCRALAPVSLASVRHSPWSSTAIVCCVMLSVLMLLAFLAMASGYERQLSSRGQPDVALVLAREATAEAGSRLSREQIEAIARMDTAARQSPELALTVSLPRQDVGRMSLNLRGMAAAGMELRPGFRLVAGRLFAPGRNELIVGHRLAEELRGVAIGETLRLMGRDWTVVGHFALDGAVFEGELWAELGAVQGSYGRDNQFQSVRVQLPSSDVAAALDALNARLATDPELQLTALTERAFFARQAEGTSRLIGYLAWPLSAVLAIGTVAGCFTTMSMAVQARRRSLRALHQLGYGAPAVFFSVLFESLLLALAGALLALGLGWLLFDGMHGTGMAAGMTSMRYEWQLDAGNALQALGLALAIGLLGGAVPAWRSLNIKQGALA